ncbi:MAG: FAD-dependent oxidoreductase [Bdellovibrionales bacterium]|nr:FAD-dependent oxidoreductase [Bdellovibrionales bacterium]
MKAKKTVAILGAGITGLSAAKKLISMGFDVEVFEKEAIVGGLARSFSDPDGFIYDNGPRFIFSTLAEKLGISDICSSVQYYEYLYIGEKKYQFPLGFIKNPLYCISVGLSMLTRKFKSKPSHLQDFLYVYYGKKLSNDILIPLIEKWSGQPCDKVSIDFAFRLLPTSITYILYSLVKKLRRGKTEDYYRKSRYIVYPEGGNRRIFEALLSTPGLSVHVDQEPLQITTDNDRVTQIQFKDSSISPDYVISTIPIPSLHQIIDKKSVLLEYQTLSYRAISILFLKIHKNKVLEGLWDWFPESHLPFYRISEYKNADSRLAPKGKTLISVEFACSADSELAAFDATQLYQSIEEELKKRYQLSRSDIFEMKVERSFHAYPVLKKDTEQIHRTISHSTKLSNLFLAGRTGAFQYKMTEGCYQSAMDCAELIYAMEHKKDLNIDQGETATSSQNFSDSFGRPNAIPE